MKVCYYNEFLVLFEVNIGVIVGERNVCVCVCVSVFFYICLWGSVYLLCVRVCVCVFGMSEFIPVYVSVRVCVGACVCVYVQLYNCVRASMCRQVYQRVFVPAGK